MKKKLKIAILVPRYGLVDRGVENFTKELVNQLRNDFEVTVFSRTKADAFTKQVYSTSSENGFINWIYHRSSRLSKWLDCFFLNPYGFEMLTFSIFSLPYLLINNYDLIFPQNGIWGAIICRLIRAIRGTAFIYRSAGGKQPPIVRQKPNMFIATTPYLAKWIKNYDSEISVSLIPNGVNCKRFSPQVKPVELKLPKPIYLCVAALIPAKRIDLTIKAVSKLTKGSLLVIGQGPLKKKLLSLGKRLLGNYRYKLIHTTYSQMPSLYTACDVFTLPSYKEPFGIVYLEAMASGLPVVATKDQSREYIVGRAGILCDVDNTNIYAHNLQKATKIDFNQLPRQQALKFDWNKIGDKYKKTLKTIVLNE